MAMRIALASVAIVLLGIIVTAAGAVIEPNSHESGQSLIALGLTFLIVGLGLFLSSTAEAA